ncbi:polyprenyl synthetase family protein [Henriciella mobilis]|uniref:Octaprenyl diphosphate synthase n=1 Tax=Henriciella mobilis TaxID=2305467 RepID=A0A399RSU1_9PROT|nr:polyprenyl synthetase family protein [Henriciella mobilis]RIJ13919.1 polyprenyl synthetase family protein [Henriciella mobilis]RIJ20872.1 polyprenyl synthetase family protein [Henriciella mobilis]RIJ32947.1 polyprenyl synthetase family protein [Henriciella mobilis]
MTITATARNSGNIKSVIDRLQSLLESDLEGVETLLRQRAKSPVDIIPDLSGYIVSAGGKRLRPMLTLAAAQAVGGANPSTHALAAAVEFIHTATLLHDDVVDESDLRRGKPAAKSVWGNSASILVGDFLFARAFTLMVETGSLEILDILSNASSVIAEGEVRQLAAQGKLDLPTEDYLAIIEAKTAALFEAAARAGALSGGSEDHAPALATYGKNLGLAFQIVDDVLDYGGATSIIGKAVGDDFREGKVTLPVIIARRRGQTEDHAFWERALNVETQTDNDLARAIHLIRTTGAAEATIAEAEAYAGLAKSALKTLPESQWRDVLSDLADFCVKRAY